MHATNSEKGSIKKNEIPFRNGDTKTARNHFRGTFLISTQRNEQTLKEPLHGMLMSSALETRAHREKTDSRTDPGSRDSYLYVCESYFVYFYTC